MALPLLTDLAPRAIVYDCMDELSAFKDAPRQMRQRETALLKSAQLVLTGGPSLYESKRALHPNVMCLPSAVDADHYANAVAVTRVEADAARRRAAGHDCGTAARLFGVIDERLDLGLVAELADADPAWQIVMVGPVVKIDPASLPQRANIHWLRPAAYELLPQLVAGWDVCLMPFALNEATRFISPTKTLEYMAAGKPIVSTAINDVKSMFSDVVRIADDASAFIEPAAPRSTRGATTAPSGSRTCRLACGAIRGARRSRRCTARSRRCSPRAPHRSRRRGRRSARCLGPCLPATPLLSAAPAPPAGPRAGRARRGACNAASPRRRPEESPAPAADAQVPPRRPMIVAPCPTFVRCGRSIRQRRPAVRARRSRRISTWPEGSCHGSLSAAAKSALA
jgi:hypothetical protein